MISNQVLQNTVDGIRDITHLDLCVMEAGGGPVIASAAVFEEALPAVSQFETSAADVQTAGAFQYFKVCDDAQLEYILIVRGTSDQALMTGKMAAFQIRSLFSAFQDQYDRDGFMKNLLLDNLLLVDIYERAKRLHIPAVRRRVVLLAETQRSGGRDHDVFVILQELAGTGSGSFVTQVDENSVVVVREVYGSDEEEQAMSFAETAMQRFQEAELPDIRIACGTVVSELKDISHSYKEAKMALDVGRIFFEDKNIIAYSQLGIGRLIYQLPLPLCRMYIKEIFKENSPEDFDEETLATINKFFENNLNVSETARQLFIHRNTLVYRLDKLQKTTGLDLRVFEDAITFKIALMVVKYMNYMDQERL